MKRIDKLRLQGEATMKKIRDIAKHIRNVQDNCFTLGEKLIEKGEIDLGRQLIANGFVHDSSKFHGIEFEHMALGQTCEEETAKLKLRLAVQHHRKTNLHHPEAWSGGIASMPDVFLAEMVCDVKARSEEFGTDLRKWIDETATTKYGFSVDSGIYKKVMGYVNLLCSTPFEDVLK